ncbi:class A beta-lactamase-related serine hydrolase [Brevundimonas sp. S30B]|uniref:serine hydrolase domain-containing protein n=1 Tax=unclassified Brevundimonas TaxID=2622653 RepID=UPI001071A656|nr:MULTISPECIES: serine hydrolase domain-containing protein [unclassified Brevundimonas]QBX37426.1 class A beta-lactamase-related serine hydrolase [Brevundimonas sp. MF30-B]TFW03781.1 class A beta-lactamase-related serine hydrolase [Brevundimonas sp. S30B]
MTVSTEFPYASISKLFTATAILQLESRGLVNLDASVTRYLPQFPYSEVTARHLLNHTSGLPSMSAMFGQRSGETPDHVITNANALASLPEPRSPLLHEPGAGANYENLNFAVLALIIETVSGENYPDYIAAHILHPAGMTQTRYLPLFQRYEEPGRTVGLAQGYYFPTGFADPPFVGSDIPYARQFWMRYALTGFGDYVGTLRDLVRFADAYDELVPQAQRAAAFRVSRMGDGSLHPNRIGLSWYIGGDEARGTLVFHAGGSIGSSCILVHNLERDQTVVVFSNSPEDVNRLAFDVTRMINGQAVETPRRSLARDYVRRLLARGEESALAYLRSHLDSPDYVLDEDELNIMGYELMAPADPLKLGLTSDLAAALTVFKTNLDLHPQSWNAFDSYGEALVKSGRTDEAIAMYRKSLELNNNPGGRAALEALLTKSQLQ